MGTFSKKTKQTTNQNTTQTAHTTPLPPPQAQTMLDDMTARIGQFGQVDPQSLVAGPSPLMQSAWGQAENLGSWSPQNAGASLMALNAGTQGPNLGGIQNGGTAFRSSSLPLPANQNGAYTYQAPTIPGVTLPGAAQATAAQLGSPSLYGGATLGAAPQGQATLSGGTTLGAAPQGQASLFGGTTLGAAPQGQSIAFGGATLGAAPQATATSFTAPQLGQAVGYSAPQADINSILAGLGSAPTAGIGDFGQAGQAGLVNFGPAGQANAVNVGPAAQASQTEIDPIERVQSQSLLDNLDAYKNPATQDLVNATLADMDTEAGRARAAYAAKGARNGAFGGSRFGLGEAALEGELIRARTAADANLRASAFDRETGLSAIDAAARQAAGSTNAAAFNQRAAIQAQLDQALKQGNVAEANRLQAIQAEIDRDIGISNASNATQMGIAQGRANADIGISNASNTTQMGIARGRAGTDANIASAGFARDYGLGALDAQTRTALANQDWQGRAAEFGAGAQNTRNLAQGGYDFGAASQNAAAANQYGLANMDMLGQYGMRQGDYAQQAGLQSNDYANRFGLENLGLQGQYGLQQGLLNQQTGLANQDATMQAMLANLGLQGQYGLQQGAFNQQTSLANQDASMQAMLANLGLQGQYGLQQGAFNQQAGLAGMDALNNYGLQQGAFNQQANMANAGWQNDQALAQGQLDSTRNLTQAGIDASALSQNTAAQNNMSQFNAQQQDNALARQLQAAGLLGQLGSDRGNQQRADIGLMGDLGQQQYGVSQAQALAPLAQLQAMSQLYGNIPWNTFTGQQVNGTSNVNGTTTTKESGSPFDSLLALGSLAMPFIKPSDRAFKTDIEPAGEQNGHQLHRYRYRWDEPDRPKRIGVMADEVEDTRPDAIHVINGARHVDYAALGLAHLVEA